MRTTLWQRSSRGVQGHFQFFLCGMQASGKRQTLSKPLTFLCLGSLCAEEGRQCCPYSSSLDCKIFWPETVCAIPSANEPSPPLRPWGASGVQSTLHTVSLIAVSHKDKGREKGIFTLFYSNRSHPASFPNDLTNREI